MCAPNEFDPMIVKLEFHIRREVDRMNFSMSTSFRKIIDDLKKSIEQKKLEEKHAADKDLGLKKEKENNMNV